MNLRNLFTQFIRSGDVAFSDGNNAQGIGDTLSKMGNKLPGCIAAGGVMALLMSNRSTRKFAGKAASFGGAALLGGLAYKASFNWQHNYGSQAIESDRTENRLLENTAVFIPADTQSPDFQLRLIKSIIAAARAAGHIDATERERIFSAVEKMDLSREVKGVIFDLMLQPITVDELVTGVENIEQRSEIYLASCLVVNPDHPSEQAHLNQLASALELPEGLPQRLQWWGQQDLAEAA